MAIKRKVCTVMGGWGRLEIVIVQEKGREGLEYNIFQVVCNISFDWPLSTVYLVLTPIVVCN